MAAHGSDERTTGGRRGGRRRSGTALAVGLGLALGVTGLPTTTASASASADGASGSAGAVAAADPPEITPACPEAYPVDELTDGQTARGTTVERGTKPSEFTATVMGVIDDGIAPDIDMVIVDTQSPALARAGGVWAGMSGSPVYAEDGRLIGAIAYGLAGASTVAGITPAEDMYRLLERPIATQAASQSAVQPKPDEAAVGNAAGSSEPPAGAAAPEVDLPAAIERRVVAVGGATAAEASTGLRQLPIPLGVSGLGQARLRTSGQQLESTFPGTRVYAAGSTSASARPAPADGIFPGSNFAASIAHGDVTMGAVGTTTAVCDVGGHQMALAFGHPFQLLGPTSMSAHVASSVMVQPDALSGPFKIANFGGVVGTVDQDRQAGIRSRAGRAPASAMVDSTVTSSDDGATRSGTTEVNLQRFLPEAAQFHLVGNLDRVSDRIGGGSSQLRWVIRGTRSSGDRFQVEVSNRYADTYDVTYASSYDIYNQLWALDNNAFDDARITSVNLSGSVSSTYTKYTIDSVQVHRPDGTLVPAPTDPTYPIDPNDPTSAPVEVVAGSRLSVRVGLRPYRNVGAVRYVDLTMNVPATAAGMAGSVNVVGGAGWWFGPVYDAIVPSPPAEAHSFDDVLLQLRGLVPNDALSATLHIDGPIWPPVPGGPDVPPPTPLPMATAGAGAGAKQVAPSPMNGSRPVATTTVPPQVLGPPHQAGASLPYPGGPSSDQTVRKLTGRVTEGNKWFSFEVVAPPK